MRLKLPVRLTALARAQSGPYSQSQGASAAKARGPQLKRDSLPPGPDTRGKLPDILQDFPVKADLGQVFDVVSTPEGLNRWWTDTCSGKPEAGASYELGFGPGYQWSAAVTQCSPRARFELTLTRADADWMGTRVGFELSPASGGTQVRFRHTGWPMPNDHYRISCHCWALYLRLLRRYLEYGEVVPYAARLDA